MVRNIGISVSPPRKSCSDKLCPFHGVLSIRGNMYSGTIVSTKAKNMAVVTREYPHPVPKYKRYERSKSKLHAYVPECIVIEEGMEVKIAECRHLSKTVSFVIIEVNRKNGSED
jgi:small subunit ribosomal protein S17